MEEKVRKFGLFDNENYQMNYNNLVGRSIHSGDVVDWEFLSNKGLAQPLFDFVNTYTFYGPQWVNLFQINKPIFRKLVREFFASFEFDASPCRYEPLLKHLNLLSRHIINLIAEWDLRKFSDIGAWCMAWLDYDEHVDSLSTMGNEVGVTSPKSTTQTLPLFEEYTPLVTYTEEVKKTLGTSIKVEPLNKTKLEEVGLNCNHNTPFSSREVPTFDGLEPQPLLNSPSLDVDVIGLEPPIKPHSPDSFRMKEMFDDDWGLESKEVSPLGEELSLFDRPNEVERGRILEVHHLESILQQQISQRMDLSHHDVVFVFDYMLYLMRRSLEVLRKFQWTILGGRFNQLSHVSSLLLSKPGEY
ncbi:hypothetical protein Tco_0593249 [Tanacetum coccineum]